MTTRAIYTFTKVRPAPKTNVGVDLISDALPFGAVFLFWCTRGGWMAGREMHFGLRGSTAVDNHDGRDPRFFR